MTNLPATKARISNLVKEYNEKKDALPKLLEDFKQFGLKVQSGCCVSGTYGNETLDVGNVYEHKAKANLIRSAWLSVYRLPEIQISMSPDDKKKFDQSLDRLPEFTIENIAATFGEYVTNPFEGILRGMAEVFTGLDHSYKSHEKVKIGVKGLPKRVIISSISNYCYGYGYDKLHAILKALAAYQAKPMPTQEEMQGLLRCEALTENKFNNSNQIAWNRGVWLKRFNNGNGHLFFDEIALTDINKALAQYYGEVLPDTPGRESKKQSTEVSKDLQYYPTPKKVVDHLVGDLYGVQGSMVLEPSCGCGRIMDALREKGAKVFGVEFDAGRANQSRSKGHKVYTANFLEMIPEPIYDFVVMNPPFYGKHYAKHVKHALNFLKEGGVLKAILPVTARYDHNLLSGRWCDLPIGSFKESGTNINTTILTIKKN